MFPDKWPVNAEKLSAHLGNFLLAATYEKRHALTREPWDWSAHIAVLNEMGLDLFCFDYGTALVLAAAWTDVVWKLGLVALRAQREVGKFHLLLASPFSPP